jgi:hypothetical protein
MWRMCGSDRAPREEAAILHRRCKSCDGARSFGVCGLDKLRSAGDPRSNMAGYRTVCGEAAGNRYPGRGTRCPAW